MRYWRYTNPSEATIMRPGGLSEVIDAADRETAVLMASRKITGRFEDHMPPRCWLYECDASGDHMKRSTRERNSSASSAVKKV